MLMLPKYTGSHPAGFASLNPENLAFMANCQSLLTQVPLLFPGDDDASALKARTLEKKRLRKLLKVPNEQMGAAKQLIAMALQEKALRGQIEWSQKIQDDLNQQDIWANLFLQTPIFQQTKFCQIQQRWQQQTAFAAFSNQALMFVAFDIVPAAASYLELLQAELKRKSQTLFGKRQYPDIETYVFYISDWLFRIKRALAQAMAGRLVLASNASDLHHSDVCVATVAALKNVGALTPDFKVPAARYQLTQTQFNAFHDFIGNVRPSLTQTLQQQVVWLKPDADYDNAIIDSKLLIVPKSILPLIPNSKRGRASAHISNKETLIDYLARHRTTLAECRILNRPVSIHDVTAGETHLKTLSAQMDKIASELTTLEKSKPTAWWARWFQRGKLKRHNALSEHWLQATSQLLDVALDGLTRLVQHWQNEFVHNGTVNFLQEHVALIGSIAHISQQAEGMGVATTIQKTTFSRLQQRYFKLYEQVKPETSRMQHYLDELARGELKSSAHLKPLTHYLEDLRQQADNTELNNFLDRAKPAATTLAKTTTRLLNRLAEQVEGLTSEECQSLGRSVHWLLQLGSDEDRDTVKKSLTVLWRTYLLKLTTSPKEPSQEWFTQCENTLSTLYLLLGEAAQADLIKTLQQERITADINTPSVSLQQKAQALLSDIDIHHWKSRCEKARHRLIETVWSQLDSAFTSHKDACHRALEQLIHQAVKEKKQSVRELTLEPYHQSLLALDIPNSPRLRMADKLVWAMQLSFDSSVEELKQLYARIEQQQTFGNASTLTWWSMRKSGNHETTAFEPNRIHNAQPIF